LLESFQELRDSLSFTVRNEMDGTQRIFTDSALAEGGRFRSTYPPKATCLEVTHLFNGYHILNLILDSIKTQKLSCFR
jgi:hypothetical protein